MTRYLAVAGLLLAFFIHPLAHLEHSHLDDHQTQAASYDGDCPLCLAGVHPALPVQLETHQEWSLAPVPDAQTAQQSETQLAFRGRAPPLG